jgi:hypothetical protein
MPREFAPVHSDMGADGGNKTKQLTKLDGETKRSLAAAVAASETSLKFVTDIRHIRV